MCFSAKKNVVVIVVVVAKIMKCSDLFYFNTGAHTANDLDVLRSRVCGVGHVKTADCDFNCRSEAVFLCSLNRVKDAVNLRMIEQLAGRVFFAHAADYDEAGMPVTAEERSIIETTKGILPRVLPVCHNPAKQHDRHNRHDMT